MTTDLNIPEQKRAERGEVFTSKRRTQRWLQELEQCSDRESAGRFIEGLKRFNRIQLRTTHRLQVAEQLRPMARYVIGRFLPRISTQRLPLDETSKRNFNGLVALTREMALAYDIVVRELDGERRPSRKRLALALERALYYRGETMMRSAPVHAPLPQNFWHAANALLRVAEKHDCARRRVRNDELVITRRKRHTPRDMYVRLLLFGLAPTDGLRRGQAERLYCRMEEWSRLAVFPARKRGDDAVLFHVDLQRPDGPKPGPPTGSDTEAESVRLLDLAPVLAEAQRALPNAPPEDAVMEADQVDAAALQRLIGAWSGSGQRGSRRDPRSEPADVETSLRRIHARLKAETEPARDEQQGDGSRPLPSLALLALQTIERADHEWQGSRKWKSGRSRDLPGAWGAGEESRAVPVAPSDKTPEQQRNWSLVDASGTGFRLRWGGEESSPANVGELVALHQRLPGADGESTLEDRWLIGVIRRVRMIDSNRFDAGVETLGQHPAPALVRREPANPHRKRDRRNEPSEPALMLPAVRSLKMPATVLVPAHTFREGDVLELDVHERFMRIRLGAPQQSSPAFSRFELSAAPPRGRSALEQTRSYSDDE